MGHEALGHSNYGTALASLAENRLRSVGLFFGEEELLRNLAGRVQRALSGLFDDFSGLHIGAILGQAKTNRTHHFFLAAWLVQIMEDLALIHCGNGALEIIVSREQHPYRMRRQFAHPGQKLGSIQPRHAHIRDHDGKRAKQLNDRQSLFTARSGFNREFFVQIARETIKEVLVVVNE